ncbi:hypothetical protein HYX12_04430 [Candidatus Woesearchaeota archaeon]|nr:hypothetical protein [Candidatus Woesearchaeota archaeon]
MVKASKLLLVFLVMVFLASTVLGAVRTFYVQETDFLKITPDAVDQDSDTIHYKYSSPLDEDGEWQTDYDDAGEYEVDVIASDGTSESNKKIRIVVANKNQPPLLAEKEIVIKEGQTIDLKDLVYDPDGDVIRYLFFSPFNPQGIWHTDYDDAGEYVISFKADDGEFVISPRININVLPTNQPPTIIQSFSSSDTFETEEDKELSFFADVVDSDDEIIDYQWTLDDATISEEKYGEHYFDYDDSGKHTLMLTLSDGKSSTKKEWSIIVKNTNRNPEINLLPIIISENEKVVVDVPEIDEDGDSLAFTFEEPLDDNGEWLTDYDDAGNYELEVTAFDGKAFGKGTVKITVVEVDRAPEIDFPDSLWIPEGQIIVVPVNISDPDHEELEINFEDLPEFAEFDEQNYLLKFNPGYDIISRKGGFLSEILNTFRKEHLFLQEKEIPFYVVVCGRDLCARKEVQLMIENTNRAPLIDTRGGISAKGNVSVLETETFKFDAGTSYDPDGDIIRYSFGTPLNPRTGVWETGYFDAGIHTVEVRASDGYLETVSYVNLTVKNNNRMPALEIKDDDLVVNELQQFMFEVKALDLDIDDHLAIKLDSLPRGASFKDGIFLWEPGHEIVDNKTDNWFNRLIGTSAFLTKKLSKDQEVVWLNFVASDGEFKVAHPVKVIVKNINQPPEMIDTHPIEELTVRAFEPVLFNVKAKDVDGDTLSYDWDFGLGQKKIIGTDTVERTFTSPGKKEVKVTISDGREIIEKSFAVKVLSQEYVAPAQSMVEETEQPPLTFKVLVIEG